MKGTGSQGRGGLLAPALVLLVATLLASRDRLLVGEAATVELVNGSAVLGAFPIHQGLIASMFLGTVLGVIAVAVVMLVAVKPWQPALGVLVAGLVGWLASSVLKEMVGRGRPLELMDPRLLDISGGYAAITGPGFPSGHATVAFAVATVVAPWLASKRRWVPWALAAVIAVARVHVGAHFPLDVVGGAALGILVGGTINLALPGRHAGA